MITEKPTTRIYHNQAINNHSRTISILANHQLDELEQIKEEIYQELSAGLRELEERLTGKIINLNMRNLNVGLTILPGTNSNYELILEAGTMKVCRRLRIECCLPDAYSLLAKLTKEQRNHYYLRINAKNVCLSQKSARTCHNGRNPYSQTL
jgi:hypothetical protein